jgi:hypothetical protein
MFILTHDSNEVSFACERKDEALWMTTETKWALLEELQYILYIYCGTT